MTKYIFIGLLLFPTLTASAVDLTPLPPSRYVCSVKYLPFVPMFSTTGGGGAMVRVYTGPGCSGFPVGTYQLVSGTATSTAPYYFSAAALHTMVDSLRQAAQTGQRIELDFNSGVVSSVEFFAN